MSAGRPRDFDEDAVLDKAIDLFWRQGYEATSLEQLLEAMQIGKGSMYHNFGNKREVFRLALNKFMHNFSSRFEADLAKAKDPAAFIREFFRDIPNQRSEEHKKGCFLGNTITELACIDQGLERTAVGHLEKLEGIFHKYIRIGQQTGKIKSGEDARVLARHLVTLWNGLNITRRMYPHAKDLAPLIEMQLKAIQ